MNLIWPRQVILYQCSVCHGRFDTETNAMAEFSPPDPFPVGTKVRLKQGGHTGQVSESKVISDMGHTKHWRRITVTFGINERCFYIKQNDDESNQLEPAN